MVSILRVEQKTSCLLKPKSGPKAKPEKALEVLPGEVELIMSLSCLLSPSRLLLFPVPRHKASRAWLGDILIWMQQIPAGPVPPREDHLLGLFWLEYGGFSIKKQALLSHYSLALASAECWLEMQDLWPHPDPLSENQHFNKISWWFIRALTFENTAQQGLKPAFILAVSHYIAPDNPRDLKHSHTARKIMGWYSALQGINLHFSFLSPKSHYWDTQSGDTLCQTAT